MAIAGESANEMTTGNVSTGTRIEFQVFADDHPFVLALPPANPAAPTVKEKTFVRRGIPVVRADGEPGGKRWTEWVSANDGSAGMIVGDGADLFPVLKRIHDDGKTTLGL